MNSYEFKSICLHAYEHPSLKFGKTHFNTLSIIRVDPLQLCAVTPVYEGFLAVMPFRRVDSLINTQHQNDEGAEFSWQSKGSAPILPTYTTYLSTSTGEMINSVKDMHFLYGFYEPTLLVLYEPFRTWSGRISTRKDTCCIVALSINLQGRANPVIWFQESLPYDCHTILSVKMPIGGVVVFATNSIIYLKQTLPSRGLPLNYYAKISTNFPFSQDVPACGPLALDGCYACLLPSPDEILVIARDGTAYILTLLLEKANNTVTDLYLSKVSSLTVAESITYLGDNRLFIGSCLSDSLLLQFNMTPKEVTQDSLALKYAENEEKGDADSAVEHTESESRSVGMDTSEGSDILLNIDEIDIQLYGPEAFSKSTRLFQVNEYEFKVLDSFLNIGPIRSISCGEVPYLAAGQTDPTDEALTQAQMELAHTELLVCADKKADNSKLFQLHQSVRARGLNTFELPEYDSLWSLYGPPVAILNQLDEEQQELQDYTKEVEIVEMTKKDVTQDFEDTLSEDISKSPYSKTDSPLHSFLLLTRDDSSMVLEIGKEIVELEVSGFRTNETTVIAANLGLQCLKRLPHQDSPLSTVKNEKRDYVVGVDYPYILQVCPTSIRLLNGPHLIEELHLTAESRVTMARVADPYVLINTYDEDLILLALKDPNSKDGATKHFPLQHPSSSQIVLSTSFDNLPTSKYFNLTRLKVAQIAPLNCFYLYHDVSGRLSQWLEGSVSSNLSGHVFGNPKDRENNADVNKADSALRTVDKEDLLLYGHILDAVKREGGYDQVMSKRMDTSEYGDNSKGQGYSEGSISPYLAFVYFSNGVLEIYSIPEFKCLYEVRNFVDLPQILTDSKGLPVVDKPIEHKEEMMPDDFAPSIRELSLTTLTKDHTRPVLLVRTDREVVCYEALCPSVDEPFPLAPIPMPTSNLNSAHSTQSPLRWRRMPVICPLLMPNRLRSDPRVADTHTKMMGKMNIMHTFEEIGGHRGVFICGSYPVWMFCNRFGRINVFPHTIDGIISSFSPLNVESCPDGFVYFTNSNEMKLATLLPGYSYESEVGIGQIPVEGKPNFVQYHNKSKTYVVITCKEAECCTVVKLTNEGLKEEEEVNRPPTCLLPKIESYKMQVLAPVLSANLCTGPTYELVPNSILEFEQFEVVSSLTTVQLSSDLTFNETKDYLAIGANMSYGEEIPVRGRIVLIDIIEVVPEPGQQLTQHKVKTVYDGDQKGPVTALASCQGFLLSAIGQKIYIWTLVNGDLEGVAFVDTNVYIHSLMTANNIILAVDVKSSIHVLRFQVDMQVLSVVSRDFDYQTAFAANFFVDGGKLGYVVTDEIGNVMIYLYEPMELASRHGQRLVRRVDVHLPSVTTASLRVGNRFRHPLLSIKALQTELSDMKKNQEKTNKPVGGSGLSAMLEYERARHSVYLGTRSGAIYVLTPIRQQTFTRLGIVEKNITNFVSSNAGLVPRACRQYHYNIPSLTNPCGNVIDGDLIQRYLLIPHDVKIEVAKKSGQSVQSIMDDIADIGAISLHF
nr:Cleavage and polyadenylation specificity factor [Hymenolepis microstoma]